MYDPLKPFLRFALSFALLFGAFALADGFRNPPTGAATQGRFGGRIAYTPDASAVVNNPANLIDFTEPEVLATFTFGYSQMEYTSPTGQKLTSEDPWYVLPGFFLILPPEENDRWAFGLGITSPYGRSSRLDDDNLFGFSTPYFTQLTSVEMAPTLSTRVNEKISLGFALNLLYSELDLRQNFPWALAAGVPGLPEGKTLFNANGAGIGATFAVTVQATENQRFAATLRTPIEVEYKGDLVVTDIPPGAPAAPESEFETEISFPLVLAVAYGIQVTERLLLETNVEWVRHSEFEQLNLDAGVNTPLLPSDSIPTEWEDNWTFGLSASYQLNPEWVLRTGYVYLESPVPSSTMLPTTAEQDQGVMSVGAGYRKDKHQVDFSYAIGIFSGRTISDNINPAFNGDYDFEAHLVSINYGYHF